MSGKPRVGRPGTNTGNTIRDSALGLAVETVDEIIALNDRVWTRSALAPSLLEIVRLRNARTVNCVYCKAVRYDVARADGLSEMRAEMIGDGYAQSELTVREKRAIALADAYLQFPVGVAQGLAVDALEEFDEKEIVTLFLSLMAFNFTSRTAVSLGGMPEDPLPVMEVQAPAAA